MPVLKWRLVDAKVLSFAAHASSTLNITFDIDAHRAEQDSPRHDMLVLGVINKYVSPRGLGRYICVVEAIWCVQIPGDAQERARVHLAMN